MNTPPSMAPRPVPPAMPPQGMQPPVMRPNTDPASQGGPFSLAAPAANDLAPQTPPTATEPRPVPGLGMRTQPPPHAIIGSMAPPAAPRYPSAYDLGGAGGGTEMANTMRDLGPALRALRSRMSGGGQQNGSLGF
jgi:hypothetical protein